MPLHDFGQPHGGIIQMAYVVPDIMKAMPAWSQEFKIGPWFHIDQFKGPDATFRGKPSKSIISGALGYSGHMMIELIQPLTEEPSVFKEQIESRGYGFNHFGIASYDFETDLARYQRLGHEVVFTSQLPSGSVAYLDPHGALPGLIELIDFSGTTETMFLSMYKASLGWDGTDPVRSLTFLPKVR